MSTTGHESEAINVSGLKASLQKLKTDHIDKKYVKPSTGIPKGDLASDVQTSLGKADTALQSHQDISGKADKTTTVNGHALSADVTVSKSDVGLGNVTDDAQVKRSEMGVANGIATLDSAGKVPSSQLPSYVDDVLEYDTKSAFPETGESGKVYVDKSTNTSWRWSGTTYVQIKGDLAIGNTSGTAADGGIANTHYSNTSNPHSVTKAQVGLGSVVNTGDSATPVAGGTTKFTTGGAYTELNKKVDKVDGKGLSTNDYTTDEKNKLAGIETAIEDCAYLENGDSSAAIADFDPQADSLWKKQQTLSAAEKVQVQQNIGVREWLNNLTGEKFASVTATDQTTSVTSLLPATGATDTVYRVGMWDGTQYNEEYYSDYAWDGTAYVQLNKKSIVGEVFDVSEYHAGATYADLAAALGVDGKNVPQSVRKGGMSIKFVQSSDSKYVQFRYLSSSTANADFTNIANWQGVDVKSAIASTGLCTTVDDSNIETGYFINENGVKTANPDYGIISVPCRKNDIVIVTTPSSSGYISVITKIVGKENTPLVVADSNVSKEYSYTVEDDTIILLSIKLNQYKAEIIYEAKKSIIDLDESVNGELINVDFSNLISGSFISETGEVRSNNDYGILTVNLLKDDEIHFTAASSSGYVSVISEGSATPYLPLVIADTSTYKEYIYKADYNKVVTLCVRKSGNYYATIKRPSKTLPLESDVILFIGQSNMAGRGVVNSTHTEDAPSVVTGTGYEFKAIKDPTKLYPITKLFGKGENTANGINDGNDKTGGMVPSFINSYYPITKTPIIGVSASQGGPMSSEWLPTGTLLPDAIQRFQDCLTFCTQKSIVIKNKYAIWCQGESDGDHSVTAETYKNNFASICSALFNAGIEKIFVCRIGEYNGSNTYDYTVIINAQTDICKTTKDIVMATTTLASFKTRGMMKDDWHYYQDAYNEMGRYSGVNVGIYQVTNKEQTMYDPKSDNLYYSHKN